jgi:hypothetical protein
MMNATSYNRKEKVMNNDIPVIDIFTENAEQRKKAINLQVRNFQTP